MTTVTPEHPYALLVGIDVAARNVRVRWITPTGSTGDGLTIPYSDDGLQRLKEHLLGLCPQPARVHITMETTGSLYLRLAHFLHAQGFAVSVVNALRIRRFADTFLQLDKTDDLDALTLARFGAALHPALWTPPSPVHEELFQRIVQRATLVRLHAQILNRRTALTFRIHQLDPVQQRQEELRKLLRRQIRAIEAELARVIAREPDWQATATRITSIPGVGLVTAAWLMMLTHNFTACDSPKQLAAFIGLVPRRRQSGESLNSYRSVGHVGHDDIRQHLFIVTLSCLRYNPRIRAYYDRIKQRRGKHKLACIAAAHKLLNLIWAVVKHQTPFDPNYLLLPAKEPIPSATSPSTEQTHA